MKKAVIALSLLASMGMANTALAADELAGTVAIQWTGSVPAATTSEDGYWLVDPAANESYDSTILREMVMVNEANKINLSSSNNFTFIVVKDSDTDGVFNPELDTEATDFSVTLTSISSGLQGAVTPNSDSDGYFKILGNEEELVYKTAKAYTAGEEAVIQVGKASDKDELAGAKVGDVWQVVANLSVTANNI